MQATSDAIARQNVPGCSSGKIMHPSRTAANIQMESLRARGGDNLNVYHCGNCGGYHVGHRYGKYRK